MIPSLPGQIHEIEELITEGVCSVLPLLFFIVFISMYAWNVALTNQQTRLC